MFLDIYYLIICWGWKDWIHVIMDFIYVWESKAYAVSMITKDTWNEPVGCELR